MEEDLLYSDSVSSGSLEHDVVHGCFSDEEQLAVMRYVRQNSDDLFDDARVKKEDDYRTKRRKLGWKIPPIPRHDVRRNIILWFANAQNSHDTTVYERFFTELLRPDSRTSTQKQSKYLHQVLLLCICLCCYPYYYSL